MRPALVPALLCALALSACAPASVAQKSQTYGGAAEPALVPGATVSGVLSVGDNELGDGSYYDLYRFDARAGAEYTVVLRSDAFDAYLAAGPGADDMEWTDDDGAGGTDARVSFTAPASGPYVVRANSLGGGETGPYTLTLTASAPGGRDPKAGPARPSRPLDPVVQVLIDNAAELMGDEGYTQEGAAISGALADGAEEPVSLELRAGEYMVVGVCDGDCSDLDLALVGPAGEAVDEDYEADDVPVVAAAAARGGTYRLTVSMASCGVDPCGYGAAVFRKE